MFKIFAEGMLTVVILSTAIVSAQKPAAPKKAQPLPSPSPEKTRVRRVAPNSATTLETSQPGTTKPVVAEPTIKSSSTPLVGSISVPATNADTSPAKTGTEEKPVEKTAATKTESVAAAPAKDDSLESLRSEIEAATDSERIKLQLKLADRLIADGKKAEALAELNRAAGSEVPDSTGFYNLGNSFARLGETEGAVGAYRKAIELRRGRYSRASNNLGVVLLRAGRWDEAQEAFLSALKIESFRYAEASYNLGRLYSARGDHDLAVREWRRAIAVDPTHKAAAQAISGIGADSRIIMASANSTATSPASSASRPLETAKTSSANARPTGSSGSVRSGKQLTLDQGSFDLLQRARNAAERGNSNEAVANFRRVLSREGGYFAPANLEMSYSLVILKQYDEALANLLQVSSREGTRYPISYFHLGRLYELRGELPQAEDAFTKAYQAFGSVDGQFLLDVSRVREKQANFKGALEALETYLAKMDQQGIKLSWSEERLAHLKAKAQ